LHRRTAQTRSDYKWAGQAEVIGVGSGGGLEDEGKNHSCGGDAWGRRVHDAAGRIRGHALASRPQMAVPGVRTNPRGGFELRGRPKKALEPGRRHAAWSLWAWDRSGGQRASGKAAKTIRPGNAYAVLKPAPSQEPGTSCWAARTCE